MKKIIFTLLLAIVSSVWTTSMALCLSPIPDAVYQPFATVSGTFASVPIPCEPIDEYPCPACLTLALQTSDRLYYLTADNADIQTQLEAIEYQLSLTTNITGSVSGTPYTEESYEYIRVQAVDTNSAPLRLPSLCDEWNIAKISNVTGPDEEIHTVKAFLGSDTIIESQNYVKLIEDSKYKGAMREGESGVIYYIPAGSAHEYLLYNFNAQVGDKLTNLWYGGRPEWCPNGYNATVLSISDETPRVFTVEVEFIITDSEGEHIIPLLVYWTEGVGLSDGPAGRFCPGPACACSCGQVLLCAYKNGEHIYTSDFGEQHGCEYNYDPFAPSDTIPLYIKDGPGTSTVEPVDPNEIVAKILDGDLLMVEYLHETIYYNLSKAPASNPSSVAAMPLNQVVAADSFIDSETVPLIESGTYSLEMSNPGWNYTIVGTFVYNALQGLETVENSKSACTKELREGQLLIRQGEQLYTPTGIRIQ